MSVPRDLVGVVQRVECGMTTEADADKLRAYLDAAHTVIAAFVAHHENGWQPDGVVNAARALLRSVGGE